MIDEICDRYPRRRPGRSAASTALTRAMHLARHARRIAGGKRACARRRRDCAARRQLLVRLGRRRAARLRRDEGARRQPWRDQVDAHRARAAAPRRRRARCWRISDRRRQRRAVISGSASKPAPRGAVRRRPIALYRSRRFHDCAAFADYPAESAQPLHDACRSERSSACRPLVLHPPRPVRLEPRKPLHRLVGRRPDR